MKILIVCSFIFCLTLSPQVNRTIVSKPRTVFYYSYIPYEMTKSIADSPPPPEEPEYAFMQDDNYDCRSDWENIAPISKEERENQILKELAEYQRRKKIQEKRVILERKQRLLEKEEFEADFRRHAGIYLLRVAFGDALDQTSDVESESDDE